MSELLLHPITERQLAAFRGQPSHAVMLVAPTGSGKLAVATQLAETVLELPPDSLATHSYSLLICSVEGKAIGIEAVRQLEHFLSLKVPAVTAFNRVVIIEEAQLLTTEAQNALLKTLEEPPSGTLVVLTVSHEQALLPTIRSRAQAISVKRPDRQQIETHFKGQNFNDQQIKQAYAISAGLPGLMYAILNQAEHPLLAATERARQLLSQSNYERLLSVDELAKQRGLAADTLFILQQMAHVSLQSTSGAAARKWQNVLQASYEAAEALETSAQLKLALTNLMLHL